MADVLPFNRPPEDPDSVLVDVDGDGIPDPVTHAEDQPGHAVAVRPSEDVALPDDTQAVELVDPLLPGGQSVQEAILARRDAERRPIVAPWATSAAGWSAAIRWVTSFYGHALLFHLLRVPQYATRVAYRAPRGAKRATAAASRWLSAAENKPLRADAVYRNDAREWRALELHRRRNTHWRWIVFTAATIAAVVGLAFALQRVPQPLVWLGAAGIAWGLAWIGSNADAPLTYRAVTAFEAPKLTSPMIEAALASLGIAGLNQALGKGGAGIGFPSPICRDGAGWRADIDLPLGVTVADIADRRDRLASALRRPLGCVWPEGADDVHEGRLVLWVGDKDLARSGTVPWPLARAGRHDIFTPVPFGVDPRGRKVGLPLIQHNILIGSLPGQGKTASVRVIACAAALDPAAELWIHELKGSGDLDALEQVAHRYVSGIDDDSIRYAADSLSMLRREVMRRADALKRLPREVCPDKRITRQIADKRAWKLWPLVCVIDECQNLFADSQYGAQAGDDAEFIIKIGRAFGVVLVLATQRPDKASLPTGVSGNVSIRFCLKVAGQVENDMILGTSAYKNGVRATLFRPEVDAGIGYLAGATTIPQVIRTAYLDGPATERIAARARLLRERAGTLSGHAIGEGTEHGTDPDQVLVDVLRVWNGWDGKAWSEDLATGLAGLHDRYTGWDAEILGDELRRRGIAVKDRHRKIDGRGFTRKGVERGEVEAALTARGKTPPLAIEPD